MFKNFLTKRLIKSNKIQLRKTWVENGYEFAGGVSRKLSKEESVLYASNTYNIENNLDKEDYKKFKDICYFTPNLAYDFLLKSIKIINIPEDSREVFSIFENGNDTGIRLNDPKSEIRTMGTSKKHFNVFSGKVLTPQYYSMQADSVESIAAITLNSERWCRFDIFEPNYGNYSLYLELESINTGDNFWEFKIEDYPPYFEGKDKSSWLINNPFVDVFLLNNKLLVFKGRSIQTHNKMTPSVSKKSILLKEYRINPENTLERNVAIAQWLGARSAMSNFKLAFEPDLFLRLSQLFPEGKWPEYT